MTEWFARPVLHVSSVETSLRFYVDRLGFTVPWRVEADGQVWADRKLTAARMGLYWTAGDVGLAGAVRFLEKNGSMRVSIRSPSLSACPPSYSS